MPKQMIAPLGDGEYAVKVGWGGAGPDVQVGVETHDERSIFWSLLGTRLGDIGKLARAAAAGHSVTGDVVQGNGALGAVTDEDIGKLVLDGLDVLTTGYRGVWAHLGRDACNHLIRTVRRARDTTFGRDE